MSRELLLRLCSILLLLILGLVGVLVGVWLRQRRPIDAPPQAIVAFLDVGHGDCTLIRTASGETILVDTGDAASAPHVVDVLHRFHVQTIDLLVLAGTDEGSIGGVPAIVTAFRGRVRYVWDNGIETHHAPQRAADAALIQPNQHIPSRIVHAGDKIQVGRATFLKVLWPPEDSPAARQDGLVLQLDYGQTRFLFAGTASMVSEGRLVAGMGDSLSCTDQCSDLVLQAPRGGAATGTSAELLRSAAPTIAVLSCSGAPDEPARITLHRLQAAGAEIRRTDTMGTVIITTDGRNAPSVTAEHL